MSFPVASGYASLQDSPLARPAYADNIIMKAYESDFLPLITNTSVLERLTSCYTTIQFMEEPDVGPWRKGELNGEIIPDNVTPGGFSVEICNMAYKAIKFDQQDVAFACNQWGAFEESFLNSVWQGLAEMWRKFTLTAMILEADSCNKGTHAGVYGNINLGTLGAARNVTGAKFARRMADLKTVLLQRNRWVDGKMFIVLPTEMTGVIIDTPYANALEMGNCVDCSLLVDGQLPGMIMGFNVITTNMAPTNMQGGDVNYYIIAGHVDAFAFAGDIVQSRLTEPSRYFAIEYQMQAVWGGKAIYPDALAIGYWKLA